MKNKELFDNTISKLTKAYFVGTLNAMSCATCAVGNICGGSQWGLLREFETLSAYSEEYLKKWECASSVKSANDSVKQSGYTLDQLLQIEQAFLQGCTNHLDEKWDVTEVASLYQSIGEEQERLDDAHFKGMMAVVGVLQEIHECSEEEVKVAKQQFVRQQA